MKEIWGVIVYATVLKVYSYQVTFHYIVAYVDANLEASERSLLVFRHFFLLLLFTLLLFLYCAYNFWNTFEEAYAVGYRARHFPSNIPTFVECISHFFADNTDNSLLLKVPEMGSLFRVLFLISHLPHDLFRLGNSHYIRSRHRLIDFSRPPDSRV